MQRVLKWVKLDGVVAIKSLELLNQVADGIVVSFTGNNAIASLRCIRNILEILGVTKQTIECNSVLQSLLWAGGLSALWQFCVSQSWTDIHHLPAFQEWHISSPEKASPAPARREWQLTQGPAAPLTTSLCR